MRVEELFEHLWQGYIKLAPAAKDIHTLLQSTQATPIINDHIALRTLAHPRCNISVISQVFLALGYERKEYYHFESKKLDAYYFQHPNETYPKVFISEVKIDELDFETQNTLTSLAESIPEEVLDSKLLVSSGRHWDVSYEVYTKLYAQSEYAAWFYLYGYCANHFTIFINALEKFDTIIEVNNLVKESGYTLNSAGGEIKGSADVLLEQSSTTAQVIEVKFNEGTYKIPSCFYEFAKRYKDENGNLYQGFVAKSADLIFNSTNHLS